MTQNCGQHWKSLIKEVHDFSVNRKYIQTHLILKIIYKEPSGSISSCTYSCMSYNIIIISLMMKSNALLASPYLLCLVWVIDFITS